MRNYHSNKFDNMSYQMNNKIRDNIDTAFGFMDYAVRSVLEDLEEHGEGTVTFLYTSNKINSDIDGINIMSQIGRNNSAGL
ncbi:hypothetical protein LCGC14_1474780, partial [marine sediment metagenome]